MNRVVRSTSVPIAELPSPKNKITFPMAGYRSFVDLGRAIANHQRIGQEGFATATSTFARQPQRSSGTKASR